MLRLTYNQALRNARGVHTSRALLKAQIFKMPAMSPTMEKGGIANWNFKEGDSFSAGDSLLEVETDKAQIDVEAQDDGVLAKIIHNNGDKDIPVGQPIAVLADPGDDLATLEMPDLSSTSAKPAAAAAPEPKKEEAPKKKEEPKKEAPKAATSGENTSATKADPEQTFFPSVASLLSENNISREEALQKIQATGPNGRIVKGDVLAYLGKITKDSLESVTSFINAHTKLDLSNIEKLAIVSKDNAAKSDSKAEEGKKAPAKPKPEPIVKTFSLERLLEYQSEAAQNGIRPFTITEYIQGASKRAERYAYQAHAVSSDHYDPIFEELVAPNANTTRFSVDLQLPKESSLTASSLPSDPLDAMDFLFDAPKAASSSPKHAEFTVSLTINPKVADSKDKANLYLKKLEHYIYDC